MGIKHFYYWYKKNFDHCVSYKKSFDIDALALDINGFFYDCAKNRSFNRQNQNFFFEAVCEKIESIRKQIEPRRYLIICVDGVAGLGKMNQQRQRRQRNGKNRFNTNVFTPGTTLMDNLTKYVDWFIRGMISKNPEWKGLEVIFSNEKVPGEGEHKLMHFLKKYVQVNQNICLFGSDADLIMLGLLLPHKHITIARPNDVLIEYVRIDCFREELVNLLSWENKNVTFSNKLVVYDFIFICFLVGNDFIPQIPFFSVINGAIDIILNTYRHVCSLCGHITQTQVINHKIVVTENKNALLLFLQILSTYEIPFLIKHYSNHETYNDPIFLRFFNDKNFESLKKDYYQGEDPKQVCHQFLDGMFWIINYYIFGIPDWRWYYPFRFAPFISDLSIVFSGYTRHSFVQRSPLPIMLQLILLLPESDKKLLPFTINEGDTYEKIRECISESSIDLTLMESLFKNIETGFTMLEKKRNLFGKSFRYRYGPNRTFASFYGNIPDCRADVSYIHTIH